MFLIKPPDDWISFSNNIFKNRPEKVTKIIKPAARRHKHSKKVLTTIKLIAAVKVFLHLPKIWRGNVVCEVITHQPDGHRLTRTKNRLDRQGLLFLNVQGLKLQ